MQLKAQKIRVNNEVNMQVAHSPTSLHFNVDHVRYSGSKVICSIHGDEFEFDYDQVLDVRGSSLHRDQKLDIFGIEVIDRRGDDRVDGDTIRTYGTAGKPDELVLVRSKTHKCFSITKWPSWLPLLDIHVRHAITMARSWQGVEKVISGLCGAIIQGGSSNAVLA